MCTFVSEGPSLYEYRTVQKTIVVGAGLWYGTKDDMAFLALKGGQKRQHNNGILTRVLLTKEDTLFAQCCWCGQPLYYFTSLQESWDEEISVGNIAHTKLSYGRLFCFPPPPPPAFPLPPRPLPLPQKSSEGACPACHSLTY